MQDTAMVVHDFILKEFLPGEIPSELTQETGLITGGILDSISTLKLVTFLEEHFGITVEAWEADVDNLDSIQHIVALVDSKKNGR
jgi:acyl carrier protein